MKRRHHLRAFTLVELLVSCLIISLGLVAASQLYVTAMWTTQKARYLSVASQRAQFELEKVRNLGFGGLVNGVNSSTPELEDSYMPEYYTYLPSNLGVGFKIGDLPNGRGTVNWKPYPDGTALKSAKMFEVTIEILWDGSTRDKSKVRLCTFVAQGCK